MRSPSRTRWRTPVRPWSSAARPWLSRCSHSSCSRSPSCAASASRACSSRWSASRLRSRCSPWSWPRSDRGWTGRAFAGRTAPGAFGRRGPRLSCATAGWRRSRPPRCSRHRRRRLLDSDREPSRGVARPSREPRGRASRSSKPRASAPGRSRPSRRWCGPAIPMRSPKPSPRSKVSGARSPLRTGAATARRSWRSSRPRTEVPPRAGDTRPHPGSDAGRCRGRRRGRSERRLRRRRLRQLRAASSR